MSSSRSQARRSARASRVMKLLATLAALPAIVLAVSPRPAHASLAGNDFIYAIGTVVNDMYWYDFGLYAANFFQQLPGPDGIPGADRTPDGQGAFAFFVGSRGAPGAVYAWRPYGNSVWAYPIYGAILSAWGSAGYENGHGYPLSAESDGAGTYAISSGCQASDRVQLFAKSGTLKYACWHPSDGSVTWHAYRR